MNNKLFRKGLVFIVFLLLIGINDLLFVETSKADDLETQSNEDTNYFNDDNTLKPSLSMSLLIGWVYGQIINNGYEYIGNDLCYNITAIFVREFIIRIGIFGIQTYFNIYGDNKQIYYNKAFFLGGFVGEKYMFLYTFGPYPYNRLTFV